MSLVVLGVVPLAGGVPAMAASAGGCAVKFRAMCGPVEVRGAAATMADVEAACGESMTSAAAAEALRGWCRGRRRAAQRDGMEVQRGGGSRSGAVRHHQAASVGNNHDVWPSPARTWCNHLIVLGLGLCRRVGLLAFDPIYYIHIGIPL